MTKESLYGVPAFVYAENIIMLMKGQNRTP